MVMRLTCVFLCLSMLLFSGEFTATVNRNQILLGENLMLTLTLKNASAKEAPSLFPLKKSFEIHSQQQSSNTMVVNGNVTTQMVWKISLSPQKEGEATIPSISIQTNQGILSSQPIRIFASRGNGSQNHPADVNGVILTTEISKAKPYKNETVIFTAQLTSKHDMVNVRIEKLNLDDAVVESKGEPKVYQKVVDGVKLHVIEFGYLITPLKPGAINIPPIKVQGESPVKQKSGRGSFFDDDFQSFFLMPDFDRLKPFTVWTEETPLEVQAPIKGMDPWLPAKSLRIEEVWDSSQTFQEGEPIIRGFKMIAEGMLSAQLPSLSDFTGKDTGFKIYFDKPESGNEVKGSTVYSYRNEQQTLIPQKSGSLTLPEVAIPWWNVEKKRMETAKIPPRALNVQKKHENTNSLLTIAEQETPVTAGHSKKELGSISPFMYLTVGCLSMLLAIAIFWAMALQRKIGRLTEMPNKDNTPEQLKKSAIKVIVEDECDTPKPLKKEKKETLPDLNPT